MTSKIIKFGLEECLSRVKTADTLTALSDAVFRIADQYGLAQAVYHAVEIPALDLKYRVFGTEVPAFWLSRYMEMKYYEISPGMARARRSPVPFDWADLTLETNEQIRYIKEQTEARIGKHAITVPVRGPGGEFAILWISSDLPLIEWRRLRGAFLQDMQVLAIHIHARFLELHGTEAVSLQSLTNREVECLQWAAHGQTIDETAETLTLSSAMVRKHLDAARSKLVARTKTQAVAKALYRGLISF